MLPVKIVRVRKLCSFILAGFVIAGCTCDRKPVEGKFEAGELHGSFLLGFPKNQQPGDSAMEVHVSLDKNKMDGTKARAIMDATAMESNWDLEINDHHITPEVVFQELSNTMSPKLNMLLKVNVGQHYWQPGKENTVRLLFNAAGLSSVATADKSSIKCFIKNFIPQQ